MSMPDPTLVARMAAVLLSDRRPGESAVPALQRAGFTGPEIVAGIDATEARLASGADTRNPALLAQARALAEAFGGAVGTGPQAVGACQSAGQETSPLYPRLLVIGAGLCLQTAPGARLHPVSAAFAAEICGVEAA